MSKKCPYEKKCGGCQYIDLPYEEQLKKKQKETNKLLSSFGKVKPIIGMKDPWHYRNKVHGVVEGTYYDAAGIATIATIPSRDELIAKFMGSIQSPVANFARVIKQIAEQKDGGAAESEAAAE